MIKRAPVLVLLACACGSETPANVAGTYTLSLTVQKNDCGILNSNVGDSSTGVEVIMTQTGSDVSGQLQGVAAVLVTVAMGTATFTGKVAGNSLDMSISGTMPGSSGTCDYTRNAHLRAKLSGDVLTGSVTYTFSTDRTADCGTRDTCQDVQIFNGTRPPSVSP